MRLITCEFIMFIAHDQPPAEIEHNTFYDNESSFDQCLAAYPMDEQSVTGKFHNYCVYG